MFASPFTAGSSTPSFKEQCLKWHNAYRELHQVIKNNRDFSWSKSCHSAFSHQTFKTKPNACPRLLPKFEAFFFFTLNIFDTSICTVVLKDSNSSLLLKISICCQGPFWFYEILYWIVCVLWLLTKWSWFASHKRRFQKLFSFSSLISFVHSRRNQTRTFYGKPMVK